MLVHDRSVCVQVQHGGRFDPTAVLSFCTWQLPTIAVAIVTTAHMFVEREVAYGTNTADLQRPIINVFRHSYIEAAAQMSNHHVLDFDGRANPWAWVAVFAAAILSLSVGWVAIPRRPKVSAVFGLGIAAISAIAIVFRQSTSASTQVVCAAQGFLVVVGFSVLVFMVPRALGAKASHLATGHGEGWRDASKPRWLATPRRLLLWASPALLVAGAAVYGVTLFVDASGVRARFLIADGLHYAIKVPLAALLNVQTIDLSSAPQQPVVLPVGAAIQFSTPSASYEVTLKTETDAPANPTQGSDIATWELLESHSDSELVFPSGSGPVVSTPEGFLQVRNPAEGRSGRRIKTTEGERVLCWVGGEASLTTRLSH